MFSLSINLFCHKASILFSHIKTHLTQISDIYQPKWLLKVTGDSSATLHIWMGTKAACEDVGTVFSVQETPLCRKIVLCTCAFHLYLNTTAVAFPSCLCSVLVCLHLIVSCYFFYTLPNGLERKVDSGSLWLQQKSRGGSAGVACAERNLLERLP